MSGISLQGDIDLIATTLQAHVTKAASYCPRHGEHDGNPCSCGWPTIDQKVDTLALEAAKRLQHNLARVIERKQQS